MIAAICHFDIDGNPALGGFEIAGWFDRIIVGGEVFAGAAIFVADTGQFIAQLLDRAVRRRSKDICFGNGGYHGAIHTTFIIGLLIAIPDRHGDAFYPVTILWHLTLPEYKI